MKSVRYYKANDIRIEDMPVPEPVGDQVRIKIKWCGICGSDLHEYLDGPFLTPGTEPHPVFGTTNPITMGHEFSGVVDAVGPDCKKLKVGDRVVPEPVIACGECPACLANEKNRCENSACFGLSDDNGAFAEYCVFTESMTHILPDNMTFEQGALIEPLAVGYHALKMGRFEPGQVAVVAGAGPIGLGIVASLKAKGAGKIIVVQRQSVRQEYAAKCGADVILDPNKDDVAAEVMKLTDGKGADIAFEATSAEQCFHLLLDCIKKGGAEVVVSIWTRPVTINLTPVVAGEKSIIGSIDYNGSDFKDVIDMISSGEMYIPPEYISKKIYLEDFIEEGMGTLTGPEKKVQVKILVTPEKDLV